MKALINRFLSLFGYTPSLPSEMNLIISKDAIRKYDYLDNEKCPLAMKLKSLGYRHVWVSSYDVRICTSYSNRTTLAMYDIEGWQALSIASNHRRAGGSYGSVKLKLIKQPA
jgi:hypothetical protein